MFRGQSSKSGIQNFSIVTQMMCTWYFTFILESPILKKDGDSHVQNISVFISRTAYTPIISLVFI